MKVALTVWEGRISPVFDVSREALVLTVEDGVVAALRNENIDTSTPAQKVDRLMVLGIETLVCGAISEPLHCELTNKGVSVFGFVAGEIDEVVATFLAGELPTPALSMPGCYGRRNRFRGKRGRESGRGHGRGRKGRRLEK